MVCLSWIMVLNVKYVRLCTGEDYVREKVMGVHEGLVKDGIMEFVGVLLWNKRKRVFF